MLKVKLFQMKSFLPASYEDKLTLRMKLAHEQLQSGTGTGGSFTGWVHLPGIMTGMNSGAFRLRLPGSRKIPRHWWS